MGDKLQCQLYGPLSVLSKGILSKSQKHRFCVFYVAPDGSSPQIHVFDKEDHFKKNSRDRKVFYLNGIQRIQYTKDKFGFDVITKKDKFSFVAENDKDFKKWVGTLKVDLNISTILDPEGSTVSDEEESDSHLYMDDNIIYESADVTPMFSVTIEDNEVASRCQLKGDYLLVVNLHNLALVDIDTKKAIYQWPYKYIRRFGKTRTNFQFEAGRKCPSGEGEFSFMTEHGFRIFEAFSKTTQKIKSFDDEPINAPIHGHVRARSDGQNVKHANVLRTSGHKSASGVPGATDGLSKSERKSVSSGGSGVQVPDFKSELDSVLKHKDEHLPVSAAVVQPPEQLKDSKKEKPKKPDKKSKKEKEKEEKAREKELRAQEKAREKEEKMKEKDKKGKIKKLEPSLSQPYPPTHTYEDVDDIPERKMSNPDPEPLYAEADTVTKPAPKPTPRKVAKPELYSEPQKLKKDAWKQHGREEEESEHQEDYDTIRVAATKMKDVHIKPPTAREEEPDETYDHIGNVCPKPQAKAEESIYGTASGKSIASIKKEKERAEMHDYEEAASKTNPKKGTPDVDHYEEPVKLGLRLPAEGEEEEDGYADVQTA